MRKMMFFLALVPFASFSHIDGDYRIGPTSAGARASFKYVGSCKSADGKYANLRRIEFNKKALSSKFGFSSHAGNLYVESLGQFKIAGHDLQERYVPVTEVKKIEVIRGVNVYSCSSTGINPNKESYPARDSGNTSLLCNYVGDKNGRLCFALNYIN